ncbi:MAG TPA: hypothetical protein PLD25_32365 [Chloroflexota bacterium]|nr:hypothetical protein [Chloroflexota bacterium]HUM69088.1 hypothetical protein [Chloroflexota bacterium]
MSYKVRFEMEFPWTVEEAEAAEWLLIRRYGLHGISYNRLARAIYQATLEAVEREAIESAAAFTKVLKKPESLPKGDAHEH